MKPAVATVKEATAKAFSNAKKRPATAPSAGAGAPSCAKKKASTLTE